MLLSVDVRDWSDDSANVTAPRFRRRLLWIARMIEYGGPLEEGQARETLIECTMRPDRRPCPGLLWVSKGYDGRIEAFCRSCEALSVSVTGWENTIWANGPMEPIEASELGLH